MNFVPEVGIIITCGNFNQTTFRVAFGKGTVAAGEEQSTVWADYSSARNGWPSVGTFVGTLLQNDG